MIPTDCESHYDCLEHSNHDFWDIAYEDAADLRTDRSHHPDARMSTARQEVQLHSGGRTDALQVG